MISGTSAALIGGGYNQQRSANNLSESQASKLSGLSRGEISNRSSKAGGASYNYQ